MKLVFRGILFSAGLFVAQFAFANRPVFNELRFDQSVPRHCRDFNIGRFQSSIRWITYSIEGAKSRGFSHEYPIERYEASDLYQEYRETPYPRRAPHGLEHEADVIREKKEYQGFDFGSEGEILEILALDDLGREYNPNDYFFTGGVEYRYSNGSTLGELDVLVGHRDSCQIIVVGETKLGLGSLSKARRQLARFKNFLSENIYSAFEFLSSDL